ncbi:unnamed protein product [Caenorhabditis nigoni]
MIFLESVFAFWQSTSKKKLAKFPLLKLPRVVLLECIENLDVLEIIIFSLLSKRTKSIANRICWSPLDIRLLYGVGGSIDFCLKQLSTHPGLRWTIEHTNDKKSSEYPYFRTCLVGPKADHYLVEWKDENTIENSKQMAAHICEVFRSPTCAINISEESQIEWLIEFQPTIRYFWICNPVIISVESLDRVFKNLTVTKYFRLKSISTDKEFRITEPIPYRSISIYNSYWVTLPAILNGTNSVIRLHDSKLTPMDINTLLREWQMGTKLRNLEFLGIRSSTLLDVHSYDNEIFRNLNWTNGDENNGRPMAIKIHDEYIYNLPEEQIVHNLIRSDGMILSLFVQYRVSESEETKVSLKMQHHTDRILNPYMAHYKHSLELKKDQGVEETLAPLKNTSAAIQWTWTLNIAACENAMKLLSNRMSSETKMLGNCGLFRAEQRKCLRDEGYEAAILLERAEQGEVDDWFGGWRGERNDPEDYPWMENDEFVNANEEMWRRQVLLDMWNSSNFIEDDDQTIEEDDDVVMAEDLLKINPSK